MELDQAARFLQELLKAAVTHKASDLFVNADFPPALKVDGRLVPLSDKPLTPEQSKVLVRSVMNERQAAEFEAQSEANFAVNPGALGRFRVNAYLQRGHAAMVLRQIGTHVPTLEELGMPAVLAEVAMHKRGLGLVVGATGSGKSTTLAAMIEARNAGSENHIITVEDPIEFLHANRRSMVSQREIGSDTRDWSSALKNALRQAPDVILIGEIRDREAMEHAIAFAQTGHLCLASLHANNAHQALERIINFFPEDRRRQLLMDLSLDLVAIVSQRLVPLKEGTGRAAALEILLRSPLVRDLVKEGKLDDLHELMKRSRDAGMQSFDQALFDLYEAQRITEDEAVRNADSTAELRQMIHYQSRHARPAQDSGLQIDRR